MENQTDEQRGIFFHFTSLLAVAAWLDDVLESLEEMSNKKNSSAADDSKMIEKYNLSVKRKLGAAWGDENYPVD